jgi:Tc toxin complex TcA C-terminal TcB-binding domain/Concanavalin A-like lectin/glucanases superfamily/Salmonella virulence plasmid 28.1kDa A protein/Neuraminidase-like domain
MQKTYSIMQLKNIMINKFIQSNPDFNIYTADLYNQVILKDYNWEDMDKTSTLQALRIRQRLLRINPNEAIADTLASLGYHSAHQIAMEQEPVFGKKYTDAVGHNAATQQQAKAIYAAAQSIRSRSWMLATLPAPTGATLPNNGERLALPDFQEGIPNYEQLFGPMLYCDCKECMSIYGPAAYFTDLMRVISEYIVPNDAKSGDSWFALNVRRPDLWQLPLDCITANHEVSYLDIVNNILAQNISTNFLGGTDAIQAAATAVYPFSSPYNLPFNQMRSYLAALGVSLPQIYKSLQAPQLAQSQALLNLSPEQYDLITGGKTESLTNLYGFYDASIADAELAEALSTQKVFLQKAGLTADELEDLVYQNLQQSTGSYVLKTGTGPIYGITNDITNADFAGTITIEMWVCPSSISIQMDFIAKNSAAEFCMGLTPTGYVACCYGDTFTTGTACTSTENTVYFNTNNPLLVGVWSHIAWVRNVETGENKVYINGVLDYASTASACVPVSSTCPIRIGYYNTSPMNGMMTEVRIWKGARTQAEILALQHLRLKNVDDPDLIAYWPLNQNASSTAVDLSANKYNTTISVANAWESVDNPPFRNEMVPSLVHSLFINAPLNTSQYIYLSPASAANREAAAIGITEGTTTTALNDTALHQLAAFIRLQKQTGWDAEALDWAILSVANGSTAINAAIIEALGGIQLLHQQYGIDIVELCSFWADIKTYGRGNDAMPQDLWDRVFNTPPLMLHDSSGTQPPYYRPIYDANPLFTSPVYQWTYKGTTKTKDLQVRGWLNESLKVNDDELTAIAAKLSSDPVVNLSVPVLSGFYRITRLAKMLALSISDLLILIDILYESMPLWSVKHIIYISDTARWMKTVGINATTLAYLLKGIDTSATSGVQKVQDKVDALLKSMRNASATVRITPDSFVSTRINQAASGAIYTTLLNGGVIDGQGLVLGADQLIPAKIYQLLAPLFNTLGSEYGVHANRPALQFDVTNQASLKFNFDPFADATIQSSNSFSMAFWVKRDELRSYVQDACIVGNIKGGGYSQTSPTLTQEINSDNVLTLLSGSSAGIAYNQLRVDDYFPPIGEWVFITWVNDNGIWRLYNNGNLFHTDSFMNEHGYATYTQTSTPYTYFISSYFGGNVAAFSLWNKVLSEADINEIMFSDLQGNEGGLINYWPMNEGGGTTVFDKQTNTIPQNGTLQGTPAPAWVTLKVPIDLPILYICKVLLDGLKNQDEYVIKSLSGLFGLNATTMAAVCELSSREVPFSTTASIPYPINQLLNVDTGQTPNQKAYLEKIVQNVTLAKSFKLTGAEIGALFTQPAIFESTFTAFTSSNLTLTQIQSLSTYKGLSQLFGDKGDALLAYFNGASGNTPNSGQINTLSSISGWSVDDITSLVGQNCMSGINFNSIAGLRVMAEVFGIAGKANVSLDTLYMFASLATIDLYTSTQVAADWQTYLDAADATVAAAKSKLNFAVVQNTADALLENWRTVLCNWLIWQLSAYIRGVRTLDDLYEYLLIDVKMTATVNTSLLVAGMNSLQLYVNRCYNNLEPAVINRVPVAWWEWMSTYRVWQANREIYLYPENYVDPTLRKIQTPQFKQLITDISKGQVNEANVAAALSTYLESVQEVANLELVDGYVVKDSKQMPGMDADEEKNIMFLIGKSRTNPPVFYTRMVSNLTDETAGEDGRGVIAASQLSFGPWEQINLSINSNYLSTVYAFSKQFIFWVEQTQKTYTNQSGAQCKAVYATIYYSWRNLSATWVKPVTLEKDILVQLIGDDVNIDYYANDYLLNLNGGNPQNSDYYLQQYCNQVKLQVLPGTDDMPEQIMIIFGPLVFCSSSADTAPTNTENSSFTPEEAAMQNQLNEAASFAWSCRSKRTTIIPTILLSAALIKSDYRTSFDVSHFFEVPTIGIVTDNQTIGFSWDIDGAEVKVTPTPDSWWPLIANNGYVSGTTVKDIIAGIGGSFVNPAPAVKEVVQQSINLDLMPFNGNNYVDIFWGRYQTLTAFTASIWVYIPSSYDFSSANILSNVYNPATGQCGWDFFISGHEFGFGIGNGPAFSEEAYLFSGITVEVNTWYFLAITVNPEASIKVQATVNNINQNIGFSYYPNTSDSSFNLILGKANGSNLAYNNFQGYMANFKFWHTPLTNQQLLDEYTSSNQAFSLSNLPSETTSFCRIGNMYGAYGITIGSQSYLALPDDSTHLLTNCISASYSAKIKGIEVVFDNASFTGSIIPLMKFIRINTDAITPMMQALTAGGVDALLTLNNQYLPEDSLQKYLPTTLVIQPGTDFMDFNGAFGIYFWEIFFYAPYLIAEKLSGNQQFATAEKWYQYVFNPTKVNPLVAYWSLGHIIDSEPTNPNALDVVGGNNGQAYNTILADYNESIFSLTKRTVTVFNGTSSYILVPYTPQLNTPTFTIMAWVYLAAEVSSGDYQSIATSRVNDTQFGYTLYLYGLSTGETQFQLWLGNGLEWSKLLLTTLPIGEWMHVAVTYDGDTARLYLNGVREISNSCSGYRVNNSMDLIIGGGNTPTSPMFYFNGNMADLAYYQTSLTAGHIADIYNNYKYQRLTNNVWQFAPFRRLNATSLYHILRGDTWQTTDVQPMGHYTASAQISIYEYDPFDADVLARMRVTPYQKALFMAYIQNLISWGDNLFTQDTWETLTDATMNYVLAEDLLGKLPMKEVAAAPQAPVTYQQIAAEYGAAGVPQFLIDMESSLSGLGASATIPQQVQSVIDAYFCIPANAQLLQYWKTVADRLYKLRHGLTITGQQNNIPLYAPPINPASLAGSSLSSAGANPSSAANPMVPYYRFNYLIAQAKSLASEAARLGSELLATLEKQDAEQLSQMQASYQTVIFNLTTQIKTTQINELQSTNQSLQASLANAKYVQQTYANYIQDGLSAGEINGLIAESAALLLIDVVAGIRAASTLPFLFPNIFGLADGGMQFGESIAAAAGALETVAQVATADGQLATTVAQYMRRNDDWVMQKNMATNQINEINAQIQANNYAIQAAQQDLELAQTQYQQSSDVYNYLQTKFTNVELYEWMSGQVSSLYYQMYQLAFSFAQSTQSAFQYELNSNQNFLNANAWNSTYQGLLAGDVLGLSLNQMENAYINGNNRKLQVKKTWSMRQNNPQALVQLVQNGSCDFDLTEVLFDQDFPGQYNRKIKMLSISIPALVGPYQNIHGTLVQTGNSVVTKPNILAVEYLAGVGNAMPNDGSLRVDWNPNQEIVISTGMNDNGMFQVNFNDEQYLPFEGTGAVSSWNLTIPQASNAFNLRSISDVIVTIDYEADDAGATFKNSVITALPQLTTYSGNQYISMRQSYSGAWFNFLTTKSLPFELATQMYPANLTTGSIKLGNSEGQVLLIPVFNKDISNPFSPSSDTITLNTTNEWDASSGMVQAGPIAAQVPLANEATWVIAMDLSANSPLLLHGNINPAALLDILVIVPFNGGVSW